MKNDYRRKLLTGGAAALGTAALAALAAPVAAADKDSAFPTRPVRIVVPFPPGGSTDITARLVAAQLSKQWGQPVTVENKPGAAANIGTEMVSRAEPDGYTMLLGTTALPISAATFAKLPYDPHKDLVPVMLVSTIANVLVVNPAAPAATVQDFLRYARDNPGKLNYASPGAATGQRLTFELLKQATGIDVVHVPYKGGAPAGQAVMGGEVESMIMNVVEATPQVKAGRLRALAVTTRERARDLPDVPTLHETVAPGIDTSVWQGVFLPGGTSDAVVGRIGAAWREALATPDIRSRLEDMGMKVVAGSPAAFKDFLDAEFTQWRDVARKANIKVE
ncbi:MAG: tripartite tricarboxylate transporter substrate binding protein [Burkholderiaceae bacterium]|nr:tripartite tricarboxylate transporter substrate binding protein [Burkholderiaceae bacterium]